MKKESSLRISNSRRVISMRIIRICGTIFCVVGIVFCSYRLIKWQVERDIAEEQIAIVSETEVHEVPDENAEIVEQETEEPKENPYWDFIKLSMLDVDFSNLKSLNSDTIGWLKVEGTSINYPFVQGSDNNFYLKHTFNRSKNSAGWVFLDYRNSQELIKNRNTIIYAHGRFDGSMFGTLKNALTEKWQTNSENQVVKISTQTKNTLWQVFSVYRILETNDYIKTDFEANNEFLVFAEKLKKRSAYDFKTTISPTDNILTLSTCIGNSDERMVLHAKLIKISNKV